METVIEKYVTLFFAYAVLGWIVESIFVAIRTKKFVNRGFLIGPYCPIYGVGICLLTFLLGRYVDDIPIMIIMSIIICGLLEYITSFLMEKIFKARWWDYSNRKFNINGRVCLETLIPFGILSVLLIKFLNPIFIDIINYTVFRWFLLVLIILFIVDEAFSLNAVFKFRKEAKNVESEEMDSTEVMTYKVKNLAQETFTDFQSRLEKLNRRVKRRTIKLSWRTRRLLQAFPNLRVNFKFLNNFRNNFFNTNKKKKKTKKRTKNNKKSSKDKIDDKNKNNNKNKNKDKDVDKNKVNNKEESKNSKESNKDKDINNNVKVDNKNKDKSKNKSS